MKTWLEDIITAYERLGGVAHYSAVYKEIEKIRPNLPESYQAIIRRTVETYSSDSEAFNGKDDIFYSVKGIGKGIWGLRSFLEDTPKAPDTEIVEGEINPDRTKTTIFRIIRDTTLTKQLKQLHNHKCQLCGKTIILPSGKGYSEAHHIQPLGLDHKGPDVAENIIIVCPNHHVMLDYGVIELSKKDITFIKGHDIDQRYIDYHNNRIALEK
jgi:predicted restriction endonuclease